MSCLEMTTAEFICGKKFSFLYTHHLNYYLCTQVHSFPYWQYSQSKLIPSILVLPP